MISFSGSRVVHCKTLYVESRDLAIGAVSIPNACHTSSVCELFFIGGNMTYFMVNWMSLCCSLGLFFTKGNTDLCKTGNVLLWRFGTGMDARAKGIRLYIRCLEEDGVLFLNMFQKGRMYKCCISLNQWVSFVVKTAFSKLWTRDCKMGRVRFFLDFVCDLHAWLGVC